MAQDPAAEGDAGQGGPEAAAKPLAEHLADRLRRDILRGALPPGAPVKERDSAAALGVSRTPMREAIRILAREGLVVLRPARSPIVADPSLKEIEDDMEVMVALEVLSGRLACERASDAEIAHTAAIQARMAAGFDSLGSLDRFEIDMAFHRSIAEGSHNRALIASHAGYLGRLWRVRYLGASQSRNTQRVLRHHGAILAAYQARDADAIAAAIDGHLGRLIDDIRVLHGQGAARPGSGP